MNGNRLLGPLRALVAVTAVALAGTAGWAQTHQEPVDYTGQPGTSTATVTIRPGDTLTAIGTTLRDADVVASTRAFVRAAAAEPKARTIGPGTYRLSTRVPAATAVAQLLDPGTLTGARVTLLDGWRFTRAVQELSTGTGLSAKALTAAFKSSPSLPSWAEGNPEGLLFPATYRFDEGSTADQIAAAVLDRFAQAAAELDLAGAAGKARLTVRQLLTVASLVTAEGRPHDYAKVARVVYNRLEERMPLQMDSTVNYALNQNGIALTAAQLATNSPYNTYKVHGLPPGPINSPGVDALHAAISPASGNWLYFVTIDTTTGETRFSKDYAEFLRNKLLLRAHLAATGNN